tara:strand:- start:178 stop:339 length:162 start_codon:yes stop_codon:yes gene_type:complete
MNKEKVKLIVRNLDLLITSLKEEIDAEVEHQYEEIVSYIEDDVDEFYDDRQDV